MRWVTATVAVAVGLALVGALGAAGISVATTTPVGTLYGWSGTDPNPLLLVMGASDRMTAAFTTTTDQGDAIWVADRSASGVWSAAHEVADGVVPGSASVASNVSGAVVAAWDKAAPDDTVSAMVTTRSSRSAPWATPVTLATDGDGFNHQITDGIDNDGRASVGYVHEAAPGSFGAFTTGGSDGTWSAPLRQSSAPVGQERLAVSANGTVTVAWTEDDRSTGDPTDLYVRRFTQTAGAWQDPQDVLPSPQSGTQPDLTLLGLTVSTNGLSALTAADRDTAHTSPYYWEDLLRSDGGASPETPCEPSCRWVLNEIGGPPSVIDPTALYVDQSNTTLDAETLPGLDGQTEISGALSNGDEFDAPYVATTKGSNSATVIASSGFRFLVGWHSSTDGGVARVRGLWTERGNEVSYVDAKTVTLGPSNHGPVLVVTKNENGYAFWEDTSAPSDALRVTDLHHTRYEDPEDVSFERTYHPSLKLPVGLVPGDGITYDVRVKHAGIRHGFGPARVWLHDVAAPPKYYKTVPGRTVCFSYRTRSALLGVSAWTPYACTTTAVDDSRLEAKHWPAHHDVNAYRETLSTARRHGATLVLHHVTATSLALLVDRRQDSGALSVSFAGESMGVFHLYGLSRQRTVLPFGGFEHPRTGTLRLRVVSRGKPVRIDGVFIARG